MLLFQSIPGIPRSPGGMEEGCGSAEVPSLQQNVICHASGVPSGRMNPRKALYDSGDHTHGDSGRPYGERLRRSLVCHRRPRVYQASSDV